MRYGLAKFVVVAAVAAFSVQARAQGAGRGAEAPLTNGSVGGFLGYFFTRQLQLKGGLIMNLSGGGPDGGTLATAIARTATTCMT